MISLGRKKNHLTVALIGKNVQKNYGESRIEVFLFIRLN